MVLASVAQEASRYPLIQPQTRKDFLVVVVVVVVRKQIKQKRVYNRSVNLAPGLRG